MSESPELSILVISYNTSELTLECLRSVHQATHETHFELIVVDNASSDGSAEAIRKEFRALKLISLDENIGFGRGNNLAAEHAGGEFLLLLNPDTVVLDGAIDELVRFAHERPQCGIWGGRTLFADRSLNPGSCWRGMSLWTLFSRAVGLLSLMPRSPLFNAAGYGGWQRDSVREVDTVSGCFLLIRRSLWEELGGFDPAFFMYGEEADLCLRARKRGARPTITPDAEIIHYGGMSETVPADKVERLLRANVTLAEKHWGSVKLWLGRLLIRLLVAVRALGYGSAALLSGNLKYREKAAIWQQIWTHRHNWLRGYR